MPTANTAESPVLLIDDGELTDVRRLLDRLGVAYEARTGTADLESAGMRKLLVTNSRHGVAIRRGRAGTWRAAGFHIIVFDARSRTLKGVLERSGCDFVVQSPVHPEAFRLLVAHALYAGPERRALSRAAMAAPVKVQTGRRSRPATLLQLSTRGGGLLTGFKVKAGSDTDRSRIRSRWDSACSDAS
jgi:hypothetical protein